MLYRLADHELFPGGEGGVLLGVDHGSLFLVDGATREAISRIGRGEFDPEGVSPADRETLRELAGIGMLVPASTPKRLPPLLPDPAEVPLSTMVLEVAQDCNLRCSYCYAAGGSYGHAPRLLDPELARQAVRRLVQDSGDQERLTLILFGGEPLLNMEAVRGAVEEAESLAELHGKELFVSLTTNATLITPEIVSFLKEHRIAVSVSMDGPPDLHDQNRRNAAGEGSYAAALSGLSGLLAAGVAPVAARVTLTPRQWSRIEEVFDHLIALGLHEVGISPASPVEGSLLPDPEQEELLFQGFSALAARFVREAAAGKILPFSNFIDLLARLHVGQTKSISCGAGLGYLAVDAGGDFYLCHRLTGEEEFRVGSVQGGADAERIGAVLKKATSGREGLCDGCWARTLCAGGCHYENHLRENLLGLPPGSSCRFVTRWLQLGIESYARLKEAGAESVLRLLGKRAKC